jgi:hypothetical protein
MSANAGVTSKFPSDHPLMSPARNLQLLNFREEVLRNAAPSPQPVQWSGQLWVVSMETSGLAMSVKNRHFLPLIVYRTGVAIFHASDASDA